MHDYFDGSKRKMKIGIVGSRRRNEISDYAAVRDAFLSLWENRTLYDGKAITEIVSGGCPKGGDRFAEELSKHFDVDMTIFYPKWKKYGKVAGLIRNTYIARDSDVLIACVAADRKGGTEDTIKKFLRKIGLTEDEAITNKLLFLV